MTLKRLLCALLCALMIASVPALAEEPAAETAPVEETARGRDRPKRPPRKRRLTEEDKDARIAELEAQVAELQAQVEAYHLKEIVASFDGGEVPLEEAEASMRTAPTSTPRWASTWWPTAWTACCAKPWSTRWPRKPSCSTWPASSAWA